MQFNVHWGKGYPFVQFSFAVKYRVYPQNCNWDGILYEVSFESTCDFTKRFETLKKILKQEVFSTKFLLNHNFHVNSSSSSSRRSSSSRSTPVVSTSPKSKPPRSFSSSASRSSGSIPTGYKKKIKI